MISPLLLNVALHGLEQAAGTRYRSTGTRAGKTVPGAPVLVRYADDFAVCCHSRQQAEQVKARLAEWLQPRGLALNEDKLLTGDALMAARAEPVNEGANVVLLQAKGDAPLAFARRHDDITIANVFRLYVDLRRDPRRGREQADNLRREVIGF